MDQVVIWPMLCNILSSHLTPHQIIQYFSLSYRRLKSRLPIAWKEVNFFYSQPPFAAVHVTGHVKVNLFSPVHVNPLDAR